MTLDELIYTRITGSDSVKESLALYGTAPALFFQKAPDDTDPGWGEEEKPRYPRAEYLVDMTADPERHSSGMVSVHIYSDDTQKPPEDIAPELRKALCDVVMQADDGAYCITWDRTELFEMQTNMNPNTLVNGCSLTFLLIAFPGQQSKDPDPVLALQEYLKHWEPESFIINKDCIENFYEPSNKRPAFYVRISGYKTAKQTYALTWIDCTVAIHVIASAPEARSSWARYLSDCLNMAGEVEMLDGSPMIIKEIAVDHAADYQIRGQMSIKAQFAVTNYTEYAHPLKKKYFS